MGRELKRKQAKREGKNVREVQKSSTSEPLKTKTFVTIIISMLLCCVVIYILSGIFITKDIKWFSKKEVTNQEEKPSITNRILAVDSLKQKEEVYYVYYYDSKKEDSTVSSVVSSLETVYRVDLSDDFNSNYVGEPSGAVDNISDLKVSDPTVIKVENGKITSFHSGATSITSELKGE